MSLPVMKIENKILTCDCLRKTKQVFIIYFFFISKLTNCSIPRPPMNAREKGRDLSNDTVYKIEM